MYLSNCTHFLSLRIIGLSRLMIFLFLTLFFYFTIDCSFAQGTFPNLERSQNCINYTGNPNQATYRKSLAFSDKGAWFAFGFSDKSAIKGGFAGPFLMTENYGRWLSPSFVTLTLSNNQGKSIMNWSESLVYQHSYSSDLEQAFKNKILSVKQQLVFLSGLTALQKTVITNTSSKIIKLIPAYHGKVLLSDVKLFKEGQSLKITSSRSTATGYIQFLNTHAPIKIISDGYYANLEPFTLKPGQTKSFVISQTFVFPQYSWQAENNRIRKADFNTVLKNAKKHKEQQLASLIQRKKAIYKGVVYSNLIAKLVLTLQNNTRIAAQGLKHAGLFPSYHYKWYDGFWAWDSWKHAAAVVNYDPELAKDQVRALFDFQQPDGFVPDCIYRDTIAQPNNYRNTKPPLATWAVWKIYENTGDEQFLKEMYPKLKAYHLWWYNERDHDHNGLCEYGSTDGTLIAAKWESGMDNAARFDNCKMLKNGEHAYSLDQESVDLNAYLYAEDNDLGKIAKVLNLNKDAEQWQHNAVVLKKKIQNQFWDASTGWFYDRNIDGTLLSNNMGCEGYIALWAGVAKKAQAAAMVKNMMNPAIFNTYLPLPTLAANSTKFAPSKGYWRGPVWIDQSYYAIVGMKKYGYSKKANMLAQKLITHAKGVLKKGVSIRENYQPITGEGLGARNFGWSAALYLLLLIGT